MKVLVLYGKMTPQTLTTSRFFLMPLHPVCLTDLYNFPKCKGAFLKSAHLSVVGRQGNHLFIWNADSSISAWNNLHKVMGISLASIHKCYLKFHGIRGERTTDLTFERWHHPLLVKGYNLNPLGSICKRRRNVLKLP